MAKASDGRDATPGSVERGEGGTSEAPRTGGSLVGSRAGRAAGAPRAKGRASAESLAGTGERDSEW